MGPDNPGRELRIYPVEGVEFRTDGDKMRFSGHAAVFNKLSDPLWGFREQVAPGAFAKTIKDGDVRFLQNHNPDLVLARSKGGKGTLTLSEDKQGLATEADMAPTSYARDLSVVMQRGDVDQMSFGFQVLREEWDETDPQNVVRTIKEVKLFDVSVVTFPAYPQTTAEVRSHMAGLLPEADATEDFATVERALAILSSDELRVGKVLSKKNRDQLESVISSLQALLEADGTTEGNSLFERERYLRQLELLGISA